MSGNYTIYTDGACSGNPGPGGWGAIIIHDGDVQELGGGDRSTTNNRMEMSAALVALRSLKDAEQITIYTDSTYLIRGITQWAWGWRKNNWKTSSGDEVSNRDLWEDLTQAIQALNKPKISWLYVRGHKGTHGNERCDEIAVAYSKGKPISLYKGPASGYIFDVTEPPPVEELPAMKNNYEKKTAYSYLSYVGGQLRRHKNWTSCERRVKGQSGARFKKAMDPLQEKEILASWGFDPETPLVEE